MHCSDRSLIIQMNNDFIVCPKAGGNIIAINYDGKLACPDYSLIYSGRVLCNDMLTLLKDVIYDYEAKTSQILNKI